MGKEHRKEDVITLLLKHGIEPNLQDNDGRTAIMLAAQKGRVEMLEPLVQHKANLEDRIKVASAYHTASEEAIEEYHTPLMIAAKNNKTKAVEKLVELGA